ncbi:MAG: class III cytochrome C family protein [Bacteroidota bacterium]
MNRTLLLVITILLSGFVLLVILFPDLMIEPGNVDDAHRSINHQCGKCHFDFSRSKTEKCMGCHRLDSIGLSWSNDNKELVSEIKSKRFHQFLKDKACQNCHQEHVGYKMKHPKAAFRHDLISDEMINECVDCHKKPADELHLQITDRCIDCHQFTQWKGAVFAHEKYFLFDKNHPSECKKCHVEKSYKTYSCYGCHEHDKQRVFDKHQEEGISDIENCVKCHRSSKKIEGESEGKEGKEGEEHSEEHDDD